MFPSMLNDNDDNEWQERVNKIERFSSTAKVFRVGIASYFDGGTSLTLI